MAKRSKKILKKKNPTQTAFTRFMLVVAFFILWIGAIGVRLVHLQVNQSEWLRDKAQDQRRDELKSKTLRGTIYDRNERALAMSVKVKSLYADPAEIQDLDATAQRVADVLKVPKQTILSSLKDAKDANKRFVWLARKLDEDTTLKLNTFLETADLRKADLPKFVGLHWFEEQKRSYPYKNLAAQVVGFANNDDIGQAGIEQSQEDLLRGATIKKVQERDRLGRVYDEEEIEQREPPKDIILTISNSIQYKVEQALEKGVKASNSKSGSAIVLDPKTGEILAMANYPTFDPNQLNAAAPEAINNRAIQFIYSPGSIFKLVTYTSAIDTNLINPDGMIDCRKGFIEVAGHRFDDPHATKIMSYADALAVSSNYAAIKTGLAVGKENFYGYAQKFGFGQPTGIELPAEARGQFRSPQTWNGDSLASMSIGYEVGVTALQMIAAYGAVANDGVRIKPHVIKEIRNADGSILSDTDAEKSPIVSQETARDFRKMLRQVVLKGTAKRAQLNGYTSAGKTGTAWKFNEKLKKVDAGKYVSSFIGMSPADNPAVVIMVVMDEPQGGARDGGQVSAPVFREIAEAILPELNVAPDANVVQKNLLAENVSTATGDKNNQPPKTESKKATKEIADTGRIKETKKEAKNSGENKKTPKQKTSVADTEKKNKSSTGKEKKKT
ncbi:MAG: peptidoglycan D,D-transpeptidase FtsI family protein [Pyrinomonadaceae bacterium]